MNDDLFVVKLPQLGTNDISATITKWFVIEGDLVKKGDLICSIETTKAVSDIESEQDGYIAIMADLNQEVFTSSPLAIICKKQEQLYIHKKSLLLDIEERNTLENKDKYTDKAFKRAKELNIKISDIDAEGIIKVRDVEKYHNNISNINNDPNTKIISGDDDSSIKDSIILTGNKKVGKDLMLESIISIPQSYAEIDLELGNLEESIKLYSTKKGVIVTVLSVFICIIGRVLKKHTLFNSYRDSDQINIYKDVNIGIIVNHENSIYIPVLKNISEQTPDKIAKELMRIRKSLMKNNPDLKDYIGATFSISPMDHTKITRFTPIVHPGQAAIVSIPTVKSKIEKVNGGFHEIRYISLGISYDHTILDANQANLFFEDVEKELSNISKYFDI